MMCVYIVTCCLFSSDLRSNAMVTVETDSLQRLVGLKTLQLADNQVEIIQEGAFHNLEALEDL